jgi:aminopeptidase N
MDVFDSITYAKGAAVLGMLEQWIGRERFRQGLAAYMKGQQLLERDGRRPVALHRPASGR